MTAEEQTLTDGWTEGGREGEGGTQRKEIEMNDVGESRRKERTNAKELLKTAKVEVLRLREERERGAGRRRGGGHEKTNKQRESEEADGKKEKNMCLMKRTHIDEVSDVSFS